MSHRTIPTRIGDVLILRTHRTFSIYAVGAVRKNGQQDFQNQTNVKHVTSRDEAIAEAKAIVIPGRRIFVYDIDTGDWSDVSQDTGASLRARIGSDAADPSSLFGVVKTSPHFRHRQ